MTVISPIERDINQIRLRIYEETKNMTPAQVSEYFRQRTDATIKKYGFKVIASARENRPRDIQGS